MFFKILLEEWRKIISETTSDIVYHFTNYDALISILTSSKFMTSVAKGIKSDEDGNRGKVYFFSMARSKLGKYSSNPSSLSAMLVLDGQKLSQKYKIVPIDYWRSSLSKSDEMEDRVVTDKPFIDNALGYIKQIHFYLETESEYNNVRSHYIDYMRKVEDLAKKAKLPLYFYVKENDFRMLNVKKSFSSVLEVLEHLESTGKDIEHFDASQYERYSEEGKSLKDLVRLIRDAETKDDVDTSVLYYRYIMYYPSDFISHLPIDIQNNRKNVKLRKYIDDIFYYMKVNKLKNFGELGEFLRTKFRKILDKKGNK